MGSELVGDLRAVEENQGHDGVILGIDFYENLIFEGVLDAVEVD